MARPIRIQYPGAVYHVMARGNRGQEIFQDDWGHYTRVTQAISRAERRPDRKLKQIKRKLLKSVRGERRPRMRNGLSQF